MIHQLSLVAFWGLLGYMLAQIPPLAFFLRKLRKWGRFRPEDDPCPKAAVILCLRGADPSLAECLRGALRQDYPDCELRVVVDSPDDPAWKVLNKIAGEPDSGKMRIRVLTDRRDTCSLKCSALVQAINDLDSTFEVVAFMDADIIPHKTWLRELVHPLSDPRVGAATGNRWYAPRHTSWGSLTRYCWNASAVVHMDWYHIAWGGSLALRRADIETSGILERWAKALCEDTMLHRELGNLGLRIAFVPSLMMINREDIGLRGCFSWIRRQFLATRLYHRFWPGMVASGILACMLPVFALGVFAAAAAVGDARAMVYSGGALLGYELGVFFLLCLMEYFVRPVADVHGARKQRRTWRNRLKTLAAIPLSQVLSGGALLSAQVIRKVVWRGVTYRIKSPYRISLVRDRPYAPDPGSENQNASL